MTKHEARTPTAEQIATLDLHIARKIYKGTKNPLIALTAFRHCRREKLHPPDWLMEAMENLSMKGEGITPAELKALRAFEADLVVMTAYSIAKADNSKGDIFERTRCVLVDDFRNDHTTTDAIQKTITRYRKRSKADPDQFGAQLWALSHFGGNELQS